MIGVASRRTTLISLALVVAIALSLVLAASTAQRAEASPLGWTVQTSPPGVTGPGELSVEAYGSYVWIAWRGGPTGRGIYVSRSTDYGATWEDPVEIDDGTSGYCLFGGVPKIVAGCQAPDGGLGLFLFYASTKDSGADGQNEIWIVESPDQGDTWPDNSAHRWHTGSVNNQFQPDADFGGGNSIMWVYGEHQAGNYNWIRYGGYLDTGGDRVIFDTVISSTDPYHSRRPVIACADPQHDSIVVWEDEAHGSYATRTLGYCHAEYMGHSWSAPVTIAYSADYDHNAAAMDWESTFPVLICQLQHTGGTYRAARYYFSFHHDKWFGNDGSDPPSVPDSIIADTGSVATCPKIDGPWGAEVRLWQSDAQYLEMYDNSSSPPVTTNNVLGTTKVQPWRYSIDCRVRGGGGVFAAIGEDGKIYYRKIDGSAPTDVQVTSPGTGGSAPTYVSSDFEMTAIALDDFAADGTDLATGFGIVDGIRRVHYEYQVDGGSWNTVECKGGDNYAYTPPYSLTALAAPLNGNTFKIRVCAEDSTGTTDIDGNMGYGESAGTIVVDTEDPGTTLTADGTAGDNGFYVSHPEVTITSSDPNVDKIEYLLTNNFNGSSSGNWTTYNKAYTLEDGIWEIEHRATDKAGNTGATTTSMVKVDTIGPVCAIERPDRDFIEIGFETGMEFRLTGSATDSNGVAWSAFLINGEERYSTKTQFNMAWVWQLPTLADAGTYEIAVAAKDMAGNVGGTSKNVVLDNFCKNWYFAEGNTLAGFDEFICLQNPGDSDTDVVIGFHLETGDVIVKNFSLPAHSRQTVVVKDHVPQGNHVSAHVHCDTQAIVVERPMYFDYRDKWAGGHNEKGVNAPQKNWYFAEGTTRKNSSDGEFEQWLCLQNPTEETATVKITYMNGSGDNTIKNYQVGPHSRKTVDVAADVGLDQDVSTAIESDIGIVAERPQYFNYHMFAPGGHNVSGVVSPLTEWYFAEGSTRQGFQEWVTIQNPNTVEAKINLKYMTAGEDGSETGSVVETERVVAPRSRDTVNVSADVGQDRDVSIELTSDVPVVAERPMYFVYGEGSWTGGHDVMGVSRPATEHYLAEGTTRDGFDTWITLQNPNDWVTNVEVRFMYPDGKTTTELLYVNPHTRVTMRVNDLVDGQCDVATYIDAGSEIVVERPMYFNYHGRTGGHNVSGYGID